MAYNPHFLHLEFVEKAAKVCEGPARLIRRYDAHVDEHGLERERPGR